MAKRYWNSTFLIVLIVACTFNTSSSLYTDPFPSYLNKMNVDIPIVVNYWGLTPSLANAITTQLPSKIVQESYYPETNRTFEWQANINSKFWGLENNLNFTTYIFPSSDIETKIEALGPHIPNVNAIDPTNSSNIISGKAIPGLNMKNQFYERTSFESYVINIANFSGFNTASNYHWITLGQTFSLSTSSSDMRNLIDLGDRQVVYDPTAIAPYFGIKHPVPLNSEGSASIIASNIQKIIEQLILGSPQSQNKLDLKESIVIDRIVLFSDKTDMVYTQLGSGLAYNLFKNEVSRLFSPLILSQRAINSFLDDVPSIRDRISSRTIEVNNSRYLFINSHEAEYYKAKIRSNYYSQYPAGWYYSIFFFADPTLQLVYNLTTSSGSITNNIREYTVGQTGFAAKGLKQWYGKSLSVLTSGWSAYMQLRLLGQNFGMSTYSSPFVNQIESPLSTYGVSNRWNYQFSNFDRDQLQRRYAVAYRTQALSTLHNIEDQYRNSMYFWIDNSGFNNVTAMINQGNYELSRLNYTGAWKIFMDADHKANQVSEPYLRARNIFRYGSILMVFVVLLLYYSDVLIQSSLKKDEFSKRIINDKY